MRKRDKAIIADLERFRVMSRDQIASIHFGNLSKPATSANLVLKRLRDRGYIDAITTEQPYLYKSAGSRLKPDSQKIPHYLAICNVYNTLIHNVAVQRFDVEVKYDKGDIEPDALAVFAGTPFYIEVQLSASYSKREFDAKLKRYEAFKREGKWKYAEWQAKNKKTFPYIVIVSKKRYDTSAFRGLPVIQVREISELVAMVKRKKA
ncbi:hypothetical protein JOD43_003918 [Pullulanibacillus pueri]|uniref:Replication-relaxation n=1 Tax=Pullulanibacillus pueri TaxID=1437324 RepID=A0A8J3EMZ7_9BACL|nr:replication-relaxation family protein [Pullulanibacillus pueri]MBM7683738.1 hypothetical protein [Pullulanibacillus pueri]GGH85117.1 hypothetical protein GCM10007096_29760 [Pullulanibacillus pueri]